MEELPDPYKDRPCKECQPFIHKPPKDTDLFPHKGVDAKKPDWKYLREYLSREGPILKKHVMSIINAFIEITKKEPNLVYVPEPVVIVGDIHGQYYDLVHMINKAGDPSKMNYLFLGDYVDRGIFGLDVMLLLMAIKINYPKSFLLLRGNHESRNMTECFTFREEVISRFDEETYDKFMEVFDNLPLSCLIDGKYLAMHGGISPNLEKISQIDEIDRF
jgi:serine/threonine-protein phosphatase 2B catalytic subunit